MLFGPWSTQHLLHTRQSLNPWPIGVVLLVAPLNQRNYRVEKQIIVTFINYFVDIQGILFLFARKVQIYMHTWFIQPTQSVYIYAREWQRQSLMRLWGKCCFHHQKNKAVRILHKENVIDHWDSHLQNLNVQNKFLEISQLEKDNRVWNRIQQGLPAGQLYFLLQAGSDTLPTPPNLRRWKLRTEAHCDLRSSTSPTTLHILNACPVALNQGRYT